MYQTIRRVEHAATCWLTRGPGTQTLARRYLPAGPVRLSVCVVHALVRWGAAGAEVEAVAGSAVEAGEVGVGTGVVHARCSAAAQHVIWLLPTDPRVDPGIELGLTAVARPGGSWVARVTAGGAAAAGAGREQCNREGGTNAERGVEGIWSWSHCAVVITHDGRGLTRQRIHVILDCVLPLRHGLLAGRADRVRQ